MPIYRFVCPQVYCPEKKVVRKLLNRTDVLNWPTNNPCVCGAVMVRATPAALGIRVVERLDNGFMSKAVERPIDIHEQIAERKKEG